MPQGTKRIGEGEGDIHGTHFSLVTDHKPLESLFMRRRPQSLWQQLDFSVGP